MDIRLILLLILGGAIAYASLRYLQRHKLSDMGCLLFTLGLIFVFFILIPLIWILLFGPI